MPTMKYTSLFQNIDKNGNITWKNSEDFWLFTTETKSPSNPTKKQPSGWRPMTSWGASDRQPSGHWAGWTGSGSIKLRPEYGGDGRYQTVTNPRGSYLGYPDALVTADLPADRVLLLNSLQKVKDQKVNLGLVIAGARQTFQTIWKDLTVWNEASKAVKRRDSLATFNTLREYANANTWKKRAKFLRAKRRFERDQKRYKSAYDKASANFWLALNFCYAQLAQDLKGSVEELDRPVAEPFVHGRSGASVEAKGNWFEGSQPASGSSFFGDVQFRARPSLIRKKYVHLAYMVDNAELRRMSQLGLTNPLTVAYDIMPWTWVFDWVLPFGKWINSLDATVGLSWLDGCIGEIDLSGFEVSEGKLYANPIAWSAGGSFTPIVMPDRRFQRVKLLTEPQMSSLIPNPRSPFKDVLWKITTIAALIAQRKR